MKKQLFFAFLMLVGTTFAQSVSDYSFEQETAAIYMNITGGTQALAASSDDGEASNIPIGFDFKYLGTTYSTVTIGVNGAISFTENDIHYSNDLTSTDSSEINMIAPLWDDLFLRTADNGEVVYKTFGTAPFRKFAVEWKNASWRNAGSTVTFKLILHESINSIEFYYGSNNSTETRSASIGFNDANGNFVSVTPGNPATVSTTTAVNNISTAEYPALKVYRFTPPTVNDFTSNAIDLPLTENCLEITANNVGATATPAYTPDCGSYNGGDFWYRFTAPPYGAIKIKRLIDGPWGAFSYSVHKESEGYNTTNFQCDYITESHVNENYFVYNLEPGESYMLRVWEWGNNDFGTITFCVAAANNDWNSNAFELEVQPENATSYIETFANNVGATASPNPPTIYNFNGGDVWFKFTAPANGQLAVVHSDTAGDWSSFAFAIYDNYSQAPDADGIIYITGYSAPYDPVIINGLTAGTTYYLRAWDYGNDNFGVSPFYLREDTTVGINNHESLSFKYYPNPTTDFINVSDDNNIHEISIVNLMGQEVKKSTPESREVSLNIADLKQGIYLMKVKVGDKTSIVKIIKK